MVGKLYLVPVKGIQVRDVDKKANSLLNNWPMKAKLSSGGLEVLKADCVESLGAGAE
jgi:hypothetical protein